MDEHNYPSKRVQRSRAKGWRMPDNTIYVGRPSRWANYARVEDHGREKAVALFERKIGQFKRLHPSLFEKWIAPLVGKDLACWCSLEEHCHADVLLEHINNL